MFAPFSRPRRFLSSCSPHPAIASAFLVVLALSGTAGVGQAEPSASVVQTAPLPARRVAQGNLYLPRFSPDGNSLLVTGQGMNGLAEINIANGVVRTLSDESRVGLNANYQADGRIHFTAKRAGSQTQLVLAADGVASAAVVTPEPIAFCHGHRVYVRTPHGVVRVGSGDRFFGPVVSPDQNMVAFVGLATGIHVHEIQSGKTHYLGPGTAPQWSPDSRTLVYEWTDDDGHQLMGSDIWSWTESQGAQPVTETETILERHPSWSPDGRHLAFDDDRGSVYIMKFDPSSAEESR